MNFEQRLGVPTMARSITASLATAVIATWATAGIGTQPALSAQRAEAGDIYAMLRGGAQPIDLRQPKAGFSTSEACPVSFKLKEDRPVPRVIPMNKVSEDGYLVAWWESDRLRDIVAGGTFDNRKRYEGDALHTVIERHPYLGGQWYFSTDHALNSPVRLVGVTAFALPINKEAQVYLEFEPSTWIAPWATGLLSNPKLPRLARIPITRDRNKAHLALLTRTLTDRVSGSPVQRVSRLGPNVLHVRWEIADPEPERNPNRAAFLFRHRGKLYWAPGAPYYYQGQQADSKEEGSYRWAKDLDGDGLPEFQYQFNGRYSAYDDFYS